MALGIMLMIVGFIIIISFFAVAEYYMVGVSDFVIFAGITILVIGFIVLMVGARKKVWFWMTLQGKHNHYNVKFLSGHGLRSLI